MLNNYEVDREGMTRQSELDRLREQAKKDNPLHSMSQCAGDFILKNNQVALTPKATRFSGFVYQYHKEFIQDTLTKSITPDPLLEQMILDTEQTKDQAAVSVLTDYLSDKQPDPLYQSHKLPNWLRLLLSRRKLWEPSCGAPAEWAVLSGFCDWLEASQCEQLDHFGATKIGNWPVFISDPYVGVSTIRQDAEFFREQLQLVVIGLPHGAWYYRTSRLVIFCPSGMR